jgi:hypothetical protein
MEQALTRVRMGAPRDVHSLLVFRSVSGANLSDGHFECRVAPLQRLRLHYPHGALVCSYALPFPAGPVGMLHIGAPFPSYGVGLPVATKSMPPCSFCPRIAIHGGSWAVTAQAIDGSWRREILPLCPR